MTTLASTSAQMYIQSPEYLSTVELCWDEPCFHHQKALMKQFLVLLSGDASDFLPGHFMLEDMSDWLISETKHTPERLRFATSEEGSDFTHLTLWVNTKLKMRTVEFQAFREFKENLSLASQGMTSSDLSYFTDEVKSVVTKGLRTISRTVSLHPCSELWCSNDVLVDLVPRLLLALLTPTHDIAFMALSDLAVTIVLEVLNKLPSTLKSPDTEVFYSRATGICMVRSVQSRLNKLSSIKELNSTLDLWSSSLISSITEAVTAQVQKLFEKPPDSFLPQTILSWMSETRASSTQFTVLPENPQELVLHLDTIKIIIGLTVIQIDDGNTESLELHNWSVIAEVENRFARYDVKVSKRVEKVTWHLDSQDIPKMAIQIHNSLRSLFGSKFNMKMALSHRAHEMSRAMAEHVVQQILTLRDGLYCEDMDDKYDEESCDSPDDGLEHILILFLQKLLTPMGDCLNPNCLSLAARISTLVRSITDKASQTSMLELEELKSSGGLGPIADSLYVDYRGRFLSSLRLGLGAFTVDPERSMLVASMLADKLLGHVPPKLSRSATHIQLSPISESYGRPEADTQPEEKTAILTDEEATQMGTNKENFGVVDATAELNSALMNIVVKPKKRGIAGFFRKVLRCCCCCISKQDLDD